MANTLTAVAPRLFSAAREVPRELVGMLGAAQRNFDDQGVALGDSVIIPISPVLASSSVTPSMTWSAGTDRTFTTKTVTLGNYRQVPWNLTAEQEKSLLNGGSVAGDLFHQTVTQAFRTIANEIEAYAANVAVNAASRAVGTAGTTPFGTAGNLSDSANALQILKDNGASGDLSYVCNTTTGANLRGIQSTLFKVNEAGTDAMLRDGELGRVHGFAFRESGGLVQHVKGGMTGALINNAAAAIGDTTITFDTGTVNTTGIKAGDVITIAGDSNKYVVTTGTTSTSGTFTIAEPGLRTAVADNSAITVGNSFTPNIAMIRNAVQVVVRPALQPAAADIEQMVVTDPVSGLSFLMIRKVGDSMASWYVRVVYDVFAINPFGIALGLG